MRRRLTSRSRKPKRWKAYKGAFFNNPHVNADRFKIERRIIDTIRHVPKGETIRIAVYSFDREGVADALIAAHKRGVKIQMLLNDHQDTHAMKRVRAVLGTNRFAKNFIYKCKQGCRTFADQYRNLHSKFYTFTQAGKSKDVMVDRLGQPDAERRSTTSGTTATSCPATSRCSTSSSTSSRT